MRSVDYSTYKMLSDVYDAKPLFEKFSSQRFVTSVENSQMTRHCWKPNRFNNVNTLRRVTRNVEKREINNVKQKKKKNMVFVINFG